MSKLSNLQRVTVRDWMGRSIRRTQRRNFKKKIIRTCAPKKSINYVKITGYWYSTAKVKTVRWSNVKTTPKPPEWKNDRPNSQSGEGSTKIHPSKQVRQRANQPFSRFSEGAEQVDPKTGWEMVSLCCFIKLVFITVAIIRQMVAGIEVGWTVNFWFFQIPIARCFAYRQWRFPCKRRSV